MKFTAETSEDAEMLLLELRAIRKSFDGVEVLHGIDWQVKTGEIHALVGENGAGKSTLIKIICGIYAPDAGSFFWKGEEQTRFNPRQAQQLGISVVHQELSLVPQLSVAENIFLGRQPRLGGRFEWLGWVSFSEMCRRAVELSGQLDMSLDPAAIVESQSIADQQKVEILRALAFQSELIIMDEPTSPLSEHECAELFRTLRKLQQQGVSVVYISHRLEEVFQIADRLTVLKDGMAVATAAVAETSEQQVVRWMIGRDLKEQFGEQVPETATHQERLRVEGLTRHGFFSEVSFSLASGEILGIAGVVGAGRTELVESIFGAPPPDRGCIFIDGREVSIRSPEEARRLGLALVADDRRTKGLVGGLSVLENLSMACPERIANRWGWLDGRVRQKLASALFESLHIRAVGLEQPVVQLSGGNQQKVVLGKWLNAASRIFLFDEPTRGIDVGAKAEIYAMIRELAASGAAVLVISSELPEILHLCHRILVMRRGRVVAELGRQEADAHTILHLALSEADAVPSSV